MFKWLILSAGVFFVAYDMFRTLVPALTPVRVHSANSQNPLNSGSSGTDQ